MPFRLATWNRKIGKSQEQNRQVQSEHSGTEPGRVARASLNPKRTDKSEIEVAVMPRNKSVKNALNVNCVSDRLMSVKLKAEPMAVLVLQVYMTTSSYDAGGANLRARHVIYKESST